MKKQISGSVRVNSYDVMCDCVEYGANHAARRILEDAAKHLDVATISEMIQNEVMNAICEKFNFND